jgi:DNA-directed RNA polymerase subunit K/omega
VSERSEVRNAFEFVTVASARARQLLSGCTPRVEAAEAKKARIAMKEVKTGAVGKEPLVKSLNPEP